MPGYWDDDDDEDDDSDYDEIAVDRHALVIEGPVMASSRRGDIGSTWWGQQWVAAMTTLRDARLDRGRTYARNGSVRDLTIQTGMAFAHVKGHRRNPYLTRIRLTPFTRAEWDRTLDALAGQAIYAAQLLAGEMPSDIEGVLQGAGLSLFPRSRKDIAFGCSCPDWGDPCKHAAAVYYLVAEQLDADPFILFHLRGHTRAQVLDGLRQRRGGSAVSGVGAPARPLVPRLDADLAAFWAGGDLVPLGRAPVVPERPPLLAQLGEPPEHVGKALASIYADVSEAAMAWLVRDEESQEGGDAEDQDAQAPD